jgi:O-antigen/teichoic acid export membrane protein
MPDSETTADPNTAVSRGESSSADEAEDGVLSAASISKLASSATLVAFGSLLYSMSNLVERVVIARFLSVDAYGQVAIGLTVLSLGMTAALLGFGQGVPRYMSRLDDEADVRGAWVTGLAIAGGMAVVVAGGLFIAAEPLSGLLLGENPDPDLLRLFALAVPFVVVLEIGVGAVRGMENTRFRTYARDLLYPGVRLGLLVGLLVVGLDVYAAGAAYVAAAAVAAVVVHLLFNRLLPLVGPVDTRPREMLAFSLPLVVSAVVGALLTRVDTLMIGALRTTAEVGLYSAAFPLATGLQLFLGSFGFMYMPLASRLDASGDLGELNRMYRLTTKWVFVLTFPVFTLLAVFPGDVLGVAFGSEYVGAASVLTVLAVGFFTQAATGRSTETLLALGLSTYALGINVVTFTANIAVNLVLIPEYGIIGAAVASAGSFITMNGITYVVLRRKFGITPFSTYSTRTFLVLPLTLLAPAVALSWVGDFSLAGLAVIGLALAAATVVVVSVTGCLQAEDRILVDLVEGKLGRELPFIRRYLPAE